MGIEEYLRKEITKSLDSWKADGKTCHSLLISPGKKTKIDELDLKFLLEYYKGLVKTLDYIKIYKENFPFNQLEIEHTETELKACLNTFETEIVKIYSTFFEYVADVRKLVKSVSK